MSHFIHIAKRNRCKWYYSFSRNLRVLLYFFPEAEVVGTNPITPPPLVYLHAPTRTPGSVLCHKLRRYSNDATWPTITSAITTELPMCFQDVLKNIKVSTFYPCSDYYIYESSVSNELWVILLVNETILCKSRPVSSSNLLYRELCKTTAVHTYES